MESLPDGLLDQPVQHAPDCTLSPCEHITRARMNARLSSLFISLDSWLVAVSSIQNHILPYPLASAHERACRLRICVPDAEPKEIYSSYIPATPTPESTKGLSSMLQSIVICVSLGLLCARDCTDGVAGCLSISNLGSCVCFRMSECLSSCGCLCARASTERSTEASPGLSHRNSKPRPVIVGRHCCSGRSLRRGGACAPCA